MKIKASLSRPCGGSHWSNVILAQPHHHLLNPRGGAAAECVVHQNGLDAWGLLAALPPECLCPGEGGPRCWAAGVWTTLQHPLGQISFRKLWPKPNPVSWAFFLLGPQAKIVFI